MKCFRLCIATVIAGIPLFLPAQAAIVSSDLLAEQFHHLTQEFEDLEATAILDSIQQLPSDLLDQHPTWKVRFLHLESQARTELSQIETALACAKRAESISHANELEELIHENYHLQGNLLLKGQQFQKGLAYLNKALPYFEAKEDIDAQLSGLSKKAFALAVLGREEEAKLITKYSREILPQANSTILSIQVYNDLAITYNILNNRLEATRMYTLAYELAEEEKYLKLLTGIGNNLLNTFLELGQFEKAKSYGKDALRIADELNLLQIKQYLLLGLSDLFLKTNEVDSSIFYLNRLESECFPAEDKILRTEIQTLRAEIYFDQDSIEKANHCIESAKAILIGEDLAWPDLQVKLGKAKYWYHKNEASKALDLLADVLANPLLPEIYRLEPLELQYKIYKQQQLAAEALLVLEQKNLIKDSLLTLERIGLIASLEADQRAERKELEIQQLELTNRINKERNQVQQRTILSLVLALIIVILAAVSFSRQRKLTLESQLAQAKEKLLRLQINPHFLFNTLNSIQSSLLQRKDEKTMQLLTRFSNLMRSVLQNSETELVSLNEELDLLSNYMELERKRLDHKFNYTIDIEEDINTNNIKIPSMILQVFVENAIWHGFRSVKNDGQIRIMVKKANKGHEIIVDDNGKGRLFSSKHKSADQKNKISLGTRLAQQRIQQLNQKFSGHFKLEIIDKPSDSGTTVILFA